MYHLQGKLPEAERLLVARLQFLRGAGAHIQYKAGLNIPYTTNLLAYNLVRQGRYAEAEPLTVRLGLEEGRDTRLVFLRLRGSPRGRLARPREVREAEPLLLTGYEGLKAHTLAFKYYASRPSRWRRLDEAGERIVRLYEAWRQPEKAAAWRARLGLADLPADVFARP